MSSTYYPPLDGAVATEGFIEAVRAERKRILRQRFGGKDPVVAGAKGTRARGVLARIVGAEREGALVEVGGELVNPAEDRAADALDAAVGALSAWGFDVVNRELATAARLARDPARQQRTSAVRALAAVVRAVVSTAPGERLGTERQALERLLPTLDHLDDVERAHYAAEAARLRQTWQEAASDAGLWRRWALVRARLAQRAGADESAIAWSLRAWDREQPSPFRPDPPLAELIAVARRGFAALVEPDVEGSALPHSGDFLLAVSATVFAHDALEAGRDVFAFVPYHAPIEAEAAGTVPRA